MARLKVGSRPSMLWSRYTSIKRIIGQFTCGSCSREEDHVEKGNGMSCKKCETSIHLSRHHKPCTAYRSEACKCFSKLQQCSILICYVYHIIVPKACSHKCDAVHTYVPHKHSLRSTNIPANYLTWLSQEKILIIITMTIRIGISNQ